MDPCSSLPTQQPFQIVDSDGVLYSQRADKAWVVPKVVPPSVCFTVNGEAVTPDVVYDSVENCWRVDLALTQDGDVLRAGSSGEVEVFTVEQKSVAINGLDGLSSGEVRSGGVCVKSFGDNRFTISVEPAV